MNQEIIIWAALVAVLLAVLVLKTVSELRTGGKSHLVEITSEQEIFFCPGDMKDDPEEGR